MNWIGDISHVPWWKLMLGFGVHRGRIYPLALQDAGAIIWVLRQLKNW